MIPTQVTGYRQYSDNEYQGDVDFYKFTAQPGSLIRIAVKPDYDNPIPLTLLELGFFSSDCNRRWYETIYYNPKYADIIVPEDGIVVIGVNAAGDYNFEGINFNHYAGGYILSIISPVASILTGRIVGANTHAGLSENQIDITLEDCSAYNSNGGYCVNTFHHASPDAQGNFRFEENYLDGNYRVMVNTNPYLYEQPAYSPSGPTGHESIVINSTNYDFGDIPLTPIIPVKSISGRVFDILTRLPLSGTTSPFARVEVYFRPSENPSGNFDQFIGEFPVNQNGEYTITRGRYDYSGDYYPLRKGDYQIRAYASQYQVTPDNTIELLNLQPTEARVAQSIGLLSYPLQISNIKPCNNVPASGSGICNFSYTLTLAAGHPKFKGLAWNTVDGPFKTENKVQYTKFQACQSAVSLIPGKLPASQIIQCQFNINANVQDTLLRVDTYIGAGTGTQPYFAVQDWQSLFSLFLSPGQSALKTLSNHEATELKRHKPQLSRP